MTYRLMRKISSGGMGEVFVAEHESTGQEVALKLILPHLLDAPDLLRRFHVEAGLASKMLHPNIVRIFDVGALRGRPFIAMQLVDGVTLDTLVQEATARAVRLPLSILRAVAQSLCSALTYVHSLQDGNGRPLQVVHRDVTPSNVLVSRTGTVLLTDFGIARVQGVTHSAANSVRGKVAYLSPEQVGGDDVDARTDVYAAALTLYEAATGSNPFRRTTLAEMLDAVRAGNAPDADRFRPELTPAMVSSLRRALAFSKQGRFESTQALAAAFIDDGPVATPEMVADFVDRICPEDSAAALSRPTMPTMSAGVRHSAPLAEGVDGVTSPRDFGSSAQDPSRVSFGRSMVALGSVALAIALAVGYAPSLKASLRAPEVETRPALPSAPGGRPRLAPFVERWGSETGAPLRLGYVTIDAPPWVEVSLDGQSLEPLLLVRYALVEGHHAAVFRNRYGGVVERVFVVSDGTLTPIRVDL